MSPSLEGIMFNRNANLSARRPLLAEPQKPLVVPPRAPPRDTGPHRPLPAPRNLPTDYSYEYRPDYWKPSNVELERRLQETRAREKVGYFQDKVTPPEISLDRREAELVFRFDPQASDEYLSSQYRAPVVHYAKPPTPANGFAARVPERDGPFVFGVHSPSQFPISRRDDDDYDYSEVAEENGRTVIRDDVSEDLNCCDKVNEWAVRDKKSRRTLNRMFQIKDRRKVKGGKKEKIKCVLVGDGAVGKSSLIAAYAQDTFREDYQPTAYDTFNDKKIQQRWRTARDTYSKEKSSDKKQPSGSASQKKKKYSFYDMLTFLDKTTDIDVDETLSEEHTQDSSLQSGNTDSQTSANKHQPSSTIELVQEQSSTETQPSTSGLQGINERTGNAKKKPKRANSEFEAELLKLLKSSELEIAPDDLAFYKSIQPALNRFNSYQKLMFRTKVLNLLMEMEHQIQSLNNFYQQESIGTNNESNYDSMSPFGDLNQTLHNTSEGDENIIVSALVNQDIVDTTTSGTDSLQHNSNID